MQCVVSIGLKVVIFLFLCLDTWRSAMATHLTTRSAQRTLHNQNYSVINQRCQPLTTWH